TDTWVNISVIPGKTIGELSQYNKLVVKMYIEGSNALQLYSQDTIYSTSNRFYFYGNENGADGGHVYATGQWIDVEIPMSHVIQLYDVLDGRSDGLGHALIVDRGKAFTAIYISDIVCVK
ncbi:MAG: hypothetical protein IKD03_04355, partial [Clostridia bacterium]|nr:hypothetical protein [Clostridia bacterium]